MKRLTALAAPAIALGIAAAVVVPGVALASSPTSGPTSTATNLPPGVSIPAYIPSGPTWTITQWPRSCRMPTDPATPFVEVDGTSTYTIYPMPPCDQSTGSLSVPSPTASLLGKGGPTPIMDQCVTLTPAKKLGDPTVVGCPWEQSVPPSNTTADTSVAITATRRATAAPAADTAKQLPTPSGGIEAGQGDLVALQRSSTTHTADSTLSPVVWALVAAAAIAALMGGLLARRRAQARR